MNTDYGKTFCIFAGNPNDKCGALTGEHCKGCKPGCKFRKTRAEADEARVAAFRRIATLSDTQQMKIAETYYDGEMPWIEGEFKPKSMPWNREAVRFSQEVY